MRHENEAPINAKPENIGKVVTIQIFDRIDNSDKIEPKSLVKVVGRLQAYSTSREGFEYRLEGCRGVTVYYSEQVVEIYVE